MFPNKTSILANSTQNPIKSLKKSVPLALLIVATLYILCNIAYFAAGASL